MTGRTAQSAMLELARQLDEHQEKRSMYAAECVSLRWRLVDAQRERDEARDTIVALTTAMAEKDLEIATLTAALDERDVEAERGLEQYDSLVRERDDLCAWQVQIAEPLGYLVRAFGVGGYDVAEPSVIMEAWRALERERDEARAEVERLKLSARLWADDIDAVSNAYRRGAEAMREACANAMHPIMRSMISRTEAAQTIRALPIPGEP
jgi:hypothetical protein